MPALTHRSSWILSATSRKQFQRITHTSMRRQSAGRSHYCQPFRASTLGESESRHTSADSDLTPDECRGTASPRLVIQPEYPADIQGPFSGCHSVRLRGVSKCQTPDGCREW